MDLTADYVGSTQVGSLSFYSATTKYREVRATAAFSARRGTITLKNVVSGQRLFIGGLAISLK